MSSGRLREYVVTLDRMKVVKGARRNIERRIMEHRFFYPKSVLLNMLLELSESFYNQIVQERTMDDCKIEMTYTWYHGEKSELTISVSDATFDHYDIH
jgi:hypothetical protein